MKKYWGGFNVIPSLFASLRAQLAWIQTFSWTCFSALSSNIWGLWEGSDLPQTSLSDLIRPLFKRKREENWLNDEKIIWMRKWVPLCIKIYYLLAAKTEKWILGGMSLHSLFLNVVSLVIHSLFRRGDLRASVQNNMFSVQLRPQSGLIRIFYSLLLKDYSKGPFILIQGRILSRCIYWLHFFSLRDNEMEKSFETVRHKNRGKEVSKTKPLNFS